MMANYQSNNPNIAGEYKLCFKIAWPFWQETNLSGNHLWRFKQLTSCVTNEIVTSHCVYIKHYSLYFNCEESAAFVCLPWVMSLKHTFPLESVDLPRITLSDSWVVNNITNIRAWIPLSECTLQKVSDLAYSSWWFGLNVTSAWFSIDVI